MRLLTDIAELEATVALLEAENARLKTDLGTREDLLAACRDASPCDEETPYLAEACASPDCVPEYIKASFDRLKANYERLESQAQVVIDDMCSYGWKCEDLLDVQAKMSAWEQLDREEIDRLKTDLGAASFIASERTRNGIVKWLRDTAQSVEVALNVDPRLPDHNRESYVSFARSVLTNLGNAIAACEDINPP